MMARGADDRIEGARRRGAGDDAACWTAVVLAGSRPGADPLALGARVPIKALVPVGGEPMVGRVVRTLLDCTPVARVLVLLQRPELLAGDGLDWLGSDPRVRVAAGSNSIGASLEAVAGTETAPWPILVTTGDHPLLTREMVEYFLAEVDGAEACVGLVERDRVLARYPQTRRSWIRLGRAGYKVANLFALRGARVPDGLRLFARAESDRKRTLWMLRRFGPLFALRSAMGLMPLDKLAAHVGRRLGLRLSTVLLPFPEAAIDVDREEDRALAERILAAAGPPAGPAGAQPFSVFDLDRTLTRRGTFSAFLLYAAWHRAPWRLLLAPIAAWHYLRYRAGSLSRKRLKERVQALLLGKSCPREPIAALASAFARRLRRRGGFRRQGLVQVEEERRQGRRIVLATAANAFYADAVARELGVDEVVCTRSVWEAGALVARIEGENCYGEAKLDRLRDRLEAGESGRSAVHVRFFSDHGSDACVMHWADQPFVVNPSRRFRTHAERMGWPVLDWR